MTDSVLKYHHAIFDLLDLEPVISPAAQAIIAQREAVCGITFPASIKEYFSLEGAADLFASKTTPDVLVPLEELGEPEEVAQGYLKVAYENQSVVIWFVQLIGSDNPPVFHDNNQYFLTTGHWEPHKEFSDIDWHFESATFTNFIYDTLSQYHFEGVNTGLRLVAEDKTPNSEMLDHLRSLYQEGPSTDLPKVKVHRFYTKHGLILIASHGEGIALSKATWTLDADSPQALEDFVKSLWHFGTLSQTLKPDQNHLGLEKHGQAVIDAFRASESI